MRLKEAQNPPGALISSPVAMALVDAVVRVAVDDRVCEHEAVGRIPRALQIAHELLASRCLVAEMREALRHLVDLRFVNLRRCRGPRVRRIIGVPSRLIVLLGDRSYRHTRGHVTEVDPGELVTRRHLAGVVVPLVEVPLELHLHELPGLAIRIAVRKGPGASIDGDGQKGELLCWHPPQQHVEVVGEPGRLALRARHERLEALAKVLLMLGLLGHQAWPSPQGEL
mmetsp:Transcript_69077/g.136963  ORF Transcript_69077/g.136963 Transcript_69077/m.136963 type:complete len:226 (+) Transcript_69077:493-1170(+)